MNYDRSSGEVLFGGEGNDTIIGGAGNDILVGAGDNPWHLELDTYTGGAGADIFALVSPQVTVGLPPSHDPVVGITQAYKEQAGAAHITDFNALEGDKLMLLGFGQISDNFSFDRSISLIYFFPRFIVRVGFFLLALFGGN